MQSRHRSESSAGAAGRLGKVPLYLACVAGMRATGLFADTITFGQFSESGTGGNEFTFVLKTQAGMRSMVRLLSLATHRTTNYIKRIC